MINQGFDPPPYLPTGSTPPHGINLPTTGLIPQYGINPPNTGPLLNLVWNKGYKLVIHKYLPGMILPGARSSTFCKLSPVKVTLQFL